MAVRHAVLVAVGIASAAYVASVRAEETQGKIDCWKQHKAYEPYVRCIASTMEPMNPAHRQSYGEDYGPEKYLKCALSRPPGDTYCDRHRLKRRSEPEYWPNAGKLPPPKWPETRREVYRTGMKPKEYFDALCKAEAGEFIFRSVENVDGVYQIRPRSRAGTYELRDRFVLEDPYDYSEAEADRPAFRFVGPDGYEFFESPRITPPRTSYEEQHYDASFFVEAPPGTKVERYHRQANTSSKVWGSVRKEFDVQTRSRHGYTWREVRRPKDRELGVVGGELIVIDLSTNEILAFRRGFAFSGYVRNVPGGFQWEIAETCPSLPNWPGGDLAPQFIKKVLKPAPYVKAQEGRNGAK